MMHGLKVPKILSRAGIERQQAVAEQTCAGTIGAIEIIGRGSQRKIGDAAFFVDRHPTPVIGPADVFPGILRPSIVTQFSGVGNSMKDPDHLAGEDVKSTNIPW